MNNRQNEMAETLENSYDYIDKLDALRILVAMYPSGRERLSDAVAAYDSIKKYKMGG